MPRGVYDRTTAKSRKKTTDKPQGRSRAAEVKKKAPAKKARPRSTETRMPSDVVRLEEDRRTGLTYIKPAPEVVFPPSAEAQSKPRFGVELREPDWWWLKREAMAAGMSPTILIGEVIDRYLKLRNAQE